MGRKLIVKVYIEDVDEKEVEITSISSRECEEKVVITSQLIQSRLREIQHCVISDETIAKTITQLRSVPLDEHNSEEENCQIEQNQNSSDDEVSLRESMFETASKSQVQESDEPKLNQKQDNELTVDQVRCNEPNVNQYADTNREVSTIENDTQQICKNDESGSRKLEDEYHCDSDVGSLIVNVSTETNEALVRTDMDISRGIVQLDDRKDSNEESQSLSPVDSIKNINYEVDDFLTKVNEDGDRSLKRVRELYVDLPTLSVADDIGDEVECERTDDESYGDGAVQEFCIIDGVMVTRYNFKTSVLEDKFLSDNAVQLDNIIESKKAGESVLTDETNSSSDSGLEVELPDIGSNFKEMVFPEPVDIMQINSPAMITDATAEQPSPRKMKTRKNGARSKIIMSPELTQKPKNEKMRSSKATVLSPELSRLSKNRIISKSTTVISPEQFQKLQNEEMQINEEIIVSPEQSQKPNNRKQHELKTATTAATEQEHKSKRKKSKVPQPRKRGVSQRSITVWLNKDLVNETMKQGGSIHDLLPPFTSSDKKQYSCTECIKNFEQKSQLVDHVTVHKGEKSVRLSEIYPRQKSDNGLSPIRPAEKETSRAFHSNGQSSDEENEPSANTLKRQYDESISSDFSRTNVKKRKLTISPSELRCEAPTVLEAVEEVLLTQDASVAKMVQPEDDLESQVTSLPETNESARRLSSVCDVVTSTGVWSCSVEVLQIPEAVPADVENQSTSATNSEMPLNEPEKCRLSRKLYKCSKCEFSCVRKYDFSIHMIQHSGSKSLYPCPSCSRVYASVFGLKYHRKKMHTPSNLAPVVLLNRIC